MDSFSTLKTTRSQSSPNLIWSTPPHPATTTAPTPRARSFTQDPIQALAGRSTPFFLSTRQVEEGREGGGWSDQVEVELFGSGYGLGMGLGGGTNEMTASHSRSIETLTRTTVPSFSQQIDVNALSQTVHSLSLRIETLEADRSHQADEIERLKALLSSFDQQQHQHQHQQQQQNWSHQQKEHFGLAPGSGSGIERSHSFSQLNSNDPPPFTPPHPHLFTPSHSPTLPVSQPPSLSPSHSPTYSFGPSTPPDFSPLLLKRRSIPNSSSIGGGRNRSISALAPIVAQAKWIAQQQQVPVQVQAQVQGGEHEVVGARKERERSESFSFPRQHGHHVGPLPSFHSAESSVDPSILVSRILTHNDQQASLFLQQQLKAPHRTADANLPILKAVEMSLVDLCKSKFGNFLVSKCLDVASKDVVESYAKEMECGKEGGWKALAEDQYGCHCLQRLIDMGSEEIRESIVTELFLHPSTLTLKSSGHVWSKLLSLPHPQSFYARLSLSGKSHWVHIAQDEVGSLIVQSVLEQWNELRGGEIGEECREGVVRLSESQWGSFVIMHLIERGHDEKMRTSILSRALSLSLDTFGSKILEKTLKVHLPMDVPYLNDFIVDLLAGTNLVQVCESSHGANVVVGLLGNTGKGSVGKDEKERLRAGIKKSAETLKKNPHGTKVWMVVQRR